MQIAYIIDKIRSTQLRIASLLPKDLRPFVEENSIQGNRGRLVVGPRGVGKTTMLLSESAKANHLYISADSHLMVNLHLSDLAEAAFAEGFEGITIDEVHHARDWSMHVKSIYDSYPNRQIWLSDSSSLILRSGAADLSRRFPKLDLPFLSFREYLFLKQGTILPVFDPFTSPPATFAHALNACNIMGLFKEYKREGFRPIFQEGDYRQKILGIIEKSIYVDIPYFSIQTSENHLRLMNAVMGHLASSPIPTLNVSSLGADWSIGKEKLYELLELMERVGLINIIRYRSDHSVSGKGAKLFFADPSMYAALDGDLGNFREAFVSTMFRQMGKAIYASKNETQGDFLVDKMTLEIGGRNKKLKGADFVIRDDMDMPGTRTIPMWSIGMMY
jgi:predicted AAA+ superfamily ATPase